MIFVTVGTQDVPFDRLLQSVENEIIKGNIKEEVVVQCGKTNFTSDRMKMVSYLEMDEFKKYIKESSLIICHGGVGSIIDALNNEKVVISCPRLYKYKEAVNDHQLQIINKFSKEGYIIACFNPVELDKSLKKAKRFKPKKYKSNTENMVKLIENFIDKN